LHAGINSLRESAYVKYQQFERSLKEVSEDVGSLRKELQSLKGQWIPSTDTARIVTLEKVLAAESAPVSLLELRGPWDRQVLSLEQRVTDVACELAGARQRVSDVVDRTARLELFNKGLEERFRDLHGLVTDEISYRSSSGVLPSAGQVAQEQQSTAVLRRVKRLEEDISKLVSDQMGTDQRDTVRQDVLELRRRLGALEASSPLQQDRAVWEQELQKAKKRVQEESEVRLLDSAAILKRLAFLEERTLRCSVGSHAGYLETATAIEAQQAKSAARVSAMAPAIG
jgi:regulator of replication initiation timing